jgi:hypothetical protein
MPESEPRLIASWVTATAIAFSSARIAFCARAAVLSQQNT